MAKKRPLPIPKPRKRELSDALFDHNSLVTRLSNGADPNSKLADVADKYPALKLDPEETYCEALSNVLTEIAEFFEYLQDECREKIEKLEEQHTEEKEELTKEHEAALEKYPFPVSVADCADADLSGMGYGLFADNLRDQWTLDNIMKALVVKNIVADEIIAYKAMT